MFKGIVTAVLFSVSTCFAAFAQSDDSVMIKKISDEILLNGKAPQNLYTLCKSVGTRLSGSAGMYKAEAWGLKALQEAGAERTYLQQCMVPHWVRGGQDKAIVTRVSNTTTARKLDVLALGNSLVNGTVTAVVLAVPDFA